MFQKPSEKNNRNDPPEELPPPDPGQADTHDTGDSREEDEESTGTERFKGLCMNCENRFDCMLPRPEGGVWHCEEYR